MESALKKYIEQNIHKHNRNKYIKNNFQQIINIKFIAITIQNNKICNNCSNNNKKTVKLP